MQAIVTKHLPPTNVRGARIKATCQAKSLTLSWDHSMGPARNHLEAAAALATQLGWDGRWIEAGLPDGSSVWTLDCRSADAFTVGEAAPSLLSRALTACNTVPRFRFGTDDDSYKLAADIERTR